MPDASPGAHVYNKPDFENFLQIHPVTGERGLWVYGYGSLVDDPGFEADERHLAVLPGYARGMVLADPHYRGTALKPGLTMGIDVKPGGGVPGAAYFTTGEAARAVFDYVYERENPRGMHYYDTVLLNVDLANGARVRAMSFVADPDSPLYVGNSLDVQEKARIIARRFGTPDPEGPSRTNMCYLVKTTMRLREEGRPAANLEELMIEAVKVRLRMMHSENEADRLLAWRLSHMERNTAVERYFKHQLGVDAVRAAMPPDQAFPAEPGAAAPDTPPAAGRAAGPAGRDHQRPGP